MVAEDGGEESSSNGSKPKKSEMVAIHSSYWLTNFPRDLMAGAMMGGMVHTVVAPIERAKLLLQTQESNIAIVGGKHRRFKGMIDCIARTVKEEGVLSLWRGNGSSVLRYYPSVALNFSLKDLYRSILRSNSNFQQSTLLSGPSTNFIAGAAAGCTTLVIIYPLDIAHTRLAADLGRIDSRQFQGIRHFLTTVYAKDGARGIYKGLPASLQGMVVHRGIYFGGFDTIKEKMSQDGEVALWKRWIAAQGVTTSAGLLSYPMDTVRRRMMMQSGMERPMYRNTLDCWKTIYLTEGVRSCKVMGLSGVDLFSPSDVVEKRDTRKVCICIRSISKKARSKQLDVPDFDIVTKTVAMSTEAIRCIRRSLESFTSSDTHGRSKHGRLKFRQKNSVVSHQQEDELSCLEESDEAKSSFSDTPYADFLYLDSGDSPDIIDRYTPTHDEFDFDFDFDFDANSEPDDHTTSIPSTLDGKVSVSCNLEPRFEEATVRNLEFSARAFSPCWDDAKSDCSVDRDIEAGNQICGTHEDSGDSLVLMKDDITNVAESIQEIGDDDNAKKEDNQLWTKGNIGVHFYSEDETKADSKDEGKDDGINCLSEANEKKIVNTEKKSTYIAPLLKTVAKGTAVIGILFLLHLRIRSDGNTNNKSNIVGFSRRKGEKGNKIYPVDKFKFGD